MMRNENRILGQGQVIESFKCYGKEWRISSRGQQVILLFQNETAGDRRFLHKVLPQLLLSGEAAIALTRTLPRGVARPARSSQGFLGWGQGER